MPFVGDIGIPGLIIILVIALIVIGPGKLPEVGSALGRGIREFRNASNDLTGDAVKATPDAATATVAAPVATAPTPAPAQESPEEQLARITRERDELAAELAAAKASGKTTGDEGASAT